MNRIHPKRAAVLVIILIIIAAAESAIVETWREMRSQPRERVNVLRSSEAASTLANHKPPSDAREREPELRPREDRPEPIVPSRRQMEEQEAARLAAQAAAEKAKFLARYLNAPVERKPGTKVVGLVACGPDESRFNSAISAALSSRFRTNTIQFVPTLFKSAFLADGVFSSSFSNPAQTFEKLELAKSVDALLLAKEIVSYTKNPGLENVLTATLELEIGAFASDPTIESKTWTFRASGAGFKEGDARAMAEERLLKQISTDTKMSLSSLLYPDR